MSERRLRHSSLFLSNCRPQPLPLSLLLPFIVSVTLHCSGLCHNLSLFLCLVLPPLSSLPLSFSDCHLLSVSLHGSVSFFFSLNDGFFSLTRARPPLPPLPFLSLFQKALQESQASKLTSQNCPVQLLTG